MMVEEAPSYYGDRCWGGAEVAEWSEPNLQRCWPHSNKLCATPGG